MHILILILILIAIKRAKCQRWVNYYVLLDLQGFLPVVKRSVSLSVCRWISHTNILKLVNKLWVRLVVGLVSGVCCHGQIECRVGYITSPSTRSRWVSWVYGYRSRIDMVKNDSVISIIRSQIVRGQTWVDGTIFTINSVFDTSLTRGTINWFDRTTLGWCE